VIPDKKIDALLDSLHKFKSLRLPYYSQPIHNWVWPEIDAMGLMQESMENFTNLFISAGLNKTGIDILLSHEIEQCLKTIHPEFNKFILWQNMLFDRSTGTVDHYDSWYLDTMPKGYLTGVSIALEDIAEESGPFRYYPNSHLEFANLKLEKLNHTQFLEQIKIYAENNEYKTALLNKGDILLWHPFLIHGSLSQVKPEFSRKSLTAHYYPLGVSRKNNDKRVLSSSLKVKISNALSAFIYPNQFDDYPIYSGHSKIHLIKFNLKGIYQIIKNSIKNQYLVKMDMRRDSY